MPAHLRWRCASGGRPLRLCPCCCAAGFRSAAGAVGGGRCGLYNHNRNHSYYRYTHHGSRLSQGPLRPHQPQQPTTAAAPARPQRLASLLQPAATAATSTAPQRRVYQTTTSTLSSSLLFGSPTSSLSSALSLSLLDLQNPPALPFSTSSSSSAPPSPIAPPSSSSPLHGSRASSWSSRNHRRRFTLWLPAIMVTQVRMHSDDSHTQSNAAHPNAAEHSHSHGLGLGHHHHHHDNVYLTSQNKKDAGVRITRIGLYSNLGMAFVKGAGGYFFNSQSMIADAWHSMTDLASDVLTLATVSWSLRPPTDRFPTGFGKVESLGSLGVSGMLLTGGLFMCMSSSQSLYAHFFLDPTAAAEVLAHAHGHSHAHVHGEGPSLHAAWLAAGTVLVKEWLYRATMKVARERKSSVLASNAVHHRVDSLTGIVTLAAILGANFIHDAAWLDPVGGLLISLMVIRAGWDNTSSALYELADRSIDDDIKRSVRQHVTETLSVPLVVPDGQEHLVEVRDVSGVKSGPNYMVDIEMAVPSEWTIETVRTIEEAVRAKVGSSVRGVRRVRVRFVKLDETTAKFDDFLSGDVSPRSSPEPEDQGKGHDHSGEIGSHKH